MSSITAKPTAKAVPPFGQIALRLGFITNEDLERALERQKSIDAAGGPHKLIGLVLVEDGAMSTTQLIRVLQLYEDLRKEGETASAK